MKVFISYSSEDKKYADLISDRLRIAGHDVWYDAWALKAGDSLLEKINHGISTSDILIVIVSQHSLKSKWVMHEFSVIALADLTSRQSRIIPVLVDKSSVPQYLSRYVYVDLTGDVESGLKQILKALSDRPSAAGVITTRVGKFRDSSYHYICGFGASFAH